MSTNKSNIRVLVLAGGKGTRLSSVVPGKPKPMAPIRGEPFLNYQLRYLKKFGFEKVTLLTGHLSNMVEQEIKDGRAFGLDISYSTEITPLGTGGAILNAVCAVSEDEFLVLNGDTFFDLDLDCFLKKSSGISSIALKYLKSNTRYGEVVLKRGGYVAGFQEKSGQKHDCYINAGVYFLRRQDLLSCSQEGFYSLETQGFPKMINNSLLRGIPMGARFIDIGIPEDYKRAQAVLPEWEKGASRPALFLDRDGVLVEDPGYLAKPHDVKIKEEIIPLLKKARDKGFYLIVVTNQAGIAKGKFSLKDYFAVESEVQRIFEVKSGIRFDATYFCPYHEDGIIEEYRADSILRKPNPGMLLCAMEDFFISYHQSIMIGDKDSDVIEYMEDICFLIEGRYPIKKFTNKRKTLEQILSMI